MPKLSEIMSISNETNIVKPTRLKLSEITTPVKETILSSKDKTEQLISQRRDPVEILKEELQYKPENIREIFFKPLTIGLKTWAIPYRRGEAALANMLMEAQNPDKDIYTGIGLSRENYINKISTKEGRKELNEISQKRIIGAINTSKRMAKEFVRGIAGERLGEIGDVPRRAGFPEFLSAYIGFGSMAGLTNLATKGKLVESTNKAGKFVLSKTPRIMGKNYLINRANLASEGLDDLYTGLSQEYDDIYNKIGDRMIQSPEKLADLADDFKEISSSLVNKIRKKISDDAPATINNLKKIKEILRKAVPSKVWSGRMSADTQQGMIKNIYGKIVDLMAEGNDDLVKLNQKYRNFMQLRQQIGDIIWDKYGNPKSSGLASLYKQGADRVKQIYFEQFAGLWPKAQQIIKDSQKFVAREGFKKGAKWMGRFVVPTGAGYWAISRLFGGQRY